MMSIYYELDAGFEYDCNRMIAGILRDCALFVSIDADLRMAFNNVPDWEVIL